MAAEAPVRVEKHFGFCDEGFPVAPMLGNQSLDSTDSTYLFSYIVTLAQQSLQFWPF